MKTMHVCTMLRHQRMLSLRNIYIDLRYSFYTWIQSFLEKGRSSKIWSLEEKNRNRHFQKKTIKYGSPNVFCLYLLTSKLKFL